MKLVKLSIYIFVKTTLSQTWYLLPDHIFWRPIIIVIESCEMVIYNYASFMPYQVAGNKPDHAVGDLATGAGE
jgi:hypothetical protein